eukprot:GHRR01004918.1.p1 GENE.GHRR01004918.1~~GHRR01004918.1.p1  ORF type:complete len:146 (+),score=57.76 GHRR01004918.1:305-742(+)
MDRQLKDPKASTQAYLEKHKVHELIEGLLADLLYHKPANPEQYIVSQLERVKVTGTKPLLNKQDLRTMFGMFDITNRGVVTEQQANNALWTVLGSRSPAIASEQKNHHASKMQLGQNEFVDYMATALGEATPLCKGIADGDAAAA